MTALSAFQWVNILALVAVIVMSALSVIRYRKSYWVVFMPPLVWSAFGVAFYSLVLGGQLSQEETLLWGAVHRFLAIMLALGAVLMLRDVLDGRGNG